MNVPLEVAGERVLLFNKVMGAISQPQPLSVIKGYGTLTWNDVHL